MFSKPECQSGGRTSKRRLCRQAALYAYNIWKGIGFIIHTCVVQYSLCYVCCSMCLHSMSASFYVASFIMLCLIFYVPSDTFQSALCYDVIFNIHYAMFFYVSTF